jgi:8-oxo-dGTP pyrophosphatase MutT (NUDIX family)
MDVITLNITVAEAFGNLYRKQCVLIAVKDSNGNILTGAKPSFFPPGITRLLGGGVDEGEDTRLAAVRELSEELDINITADQLTPIAQFNTSATDANGKEFYNETFLFGVSIDDTPYQPGDDVKQIMALSKDQMEALAQSFASLPESLWYRGSEGDFSWHDYGKLYSVIHHVAAEAQF